MTKTPRGLNEAPREYKIEDTVLQIRKIGNSVGVILPKELLARLNLKEGDKFYPVEQPDGGLRLSPYDPNHRADDGNRPRGHARISRYACRACKMSEPFWLDSSMKSSTCTTSNWRYSADASRLARSGPAGVGGRCGRSINGHYGQTDTGRARRSLCVRPCPQPRLCGRQQAHRVPWRMMVFLRVNGIDFACPIRRTPRPSSFPSPRAKSARKA